MLVRQGIKYNYIKKGLNKMDNTGKLLAGVAIGAVAIFALVTLVDVDVTGDLDVPSVEMSGGDITMPELEGGNFDLPNVETSGGDMPRVDVNTADVDVVEREATVDVPTDVNVETEERTFSIPSLEVTKPEEDTYAEEDDLN